MALPGYRLHAGRQQDRFSSFLMLICRLGRAPNGWLLQGHMVAKASHAFDEPSSAPSSG